MNICVYGAASSLIDEKYKEVGRELGRKIAEHGHNLVFGGGANGMMGAVAEGVHEKNGEIIGIIPEFFKEAGSEISFKACTEYIYTETMSDRKKLLEDKADAVIVAPGGIGTFDEYFGVLTLKQLGKFNKPIVLFDIDGFYDQLDLLMDRLIDEKFITDDCKALYKVYRSVDVILDYIEGYDTETIDLDKVKIR
jgi:hypothetical protein